MGDDRSLEIAESLRALRDQADQTHNAHCQSVEQLELQISEQLEKIADELAAEQQSGQQARKESTGQQKTLQKLQVAISEKEAEAEQLLDRIVEQTLDFEKQIEERDQELAELLDLAEEENQQRETLEKELQQTHAALEQADALECAECVAGQNALSSAELQIGDLSKQTESLRKQQRTLEEELDSARKNLEEVQQQGDQNEEQLEQTRRKFELALADVHKLKRENAELHEELLSRPEANDQESPELISLRSERDALAARIEELETASVQAVTTDGQQELDDLQRRFEMAVDDVRQLKQENADLRQKLETAQQGVTSLPAEEPQDWQSQKARLLASLEAEDQNGMAEGRREERATIEGTISITDSVVAEKDQRAAHQERELQELRDQLVERPAAENLEELRQQITDEILGDDEAIQVEQARLQAQQQLLDDKLREAELEISVQRATLARDRATLEEKLANLPVPSVDEDEHADSTGKPRRRWLKALGIKDEEAEG